MSNTSVEISNNLWKKGLLVDDELKSKTSQKNLLNSLNIPSEYILFAPDFETALELLQKHPDIESCIVDVRIPKNSYDFYDYKNDEQPDWGISLLPKINQLNDRAKIKIYSAQVPRDYIKAKIAEFEAINNIQGFYGKDETKNKRNDIIRSEFLKSSFDYSYLGHNNANIVKVETIKIKNSYKSLFEKIIEIGESLIKVKKILGRGNFGPWLESEFNMHPKTAQRCMNVAKAFKLDRADDEIDSDITFKFVPSALFSLSEKSAPEAAREEAIAKAKKGEKITVNLALELKEKYKKVKHNSQQKTQGDASPSFQRRVLGQNTLSQKPPQKDGASVTAFSGNKTEKKQSSVAEVQVQPDTQTAQSKQKIVKLIPQQNVWQLGQHFLFCGDPNSARFLEHLPSKISLNIAFPQDRSWHFSYPHQIDSSTSFSSIFQKDLEPGFFQSTLEEIIRSTTDANNIATICFCPHPIILKTAHYLGLRCYIAEPDPIKCQALVTHCKQLK